MIATYVLLRKKEDLDAIKISNASDSTLKFIKFPFSKVSLQCFKE
jgi:hypothetical protein